MTRDHGDPFAIADGEADSVQPTLLTERRRHILDTDHLLAVHLVGAEDDMRRLSGRGRDRFNVKLRQHLLARGGLS